jgi:hypothetical protein
MRNSGLKAPGGVAGQLARRAGSSGSSCCSAMMSDPSSASLSPGVRRSRSGRSDCRSGRSRWRRTSSATRTRRTAQRFRSAARIGASRRAAGHRRRRRPSGMRLRNRDCPQASSRRAGANQVARRVLRKLPAPVIERADFKEVEVVVEAVVGEVPAILLRVLTRLQRLLDARSPAGQPLGERRRKLRICVDVRGAGLEQTERLNRCW